MKKKKILALLCLLCLFLTGCMGNGNQESSEQSFRELENKPEKLVVYITGVASSFMQDNGEMYTRYPTPYSVGLHFMGGDMQAEQGNIFYDALMQYGEERGITMEIHFLADKSGMEDFTQDVLQYAYEQGEAPDLIVVSKYTELDFYRLQQQGQLVDFSDYVQSDEALQNEEAYFGKVLDGGMIHDEQVVMPLLFNMNAMVTGKNWLGRAGLAEPTEETSYEEILHMLEQSCLETAGSDIQEAVQEISGRMFLGSYIPSILLAGATDSYFNEENTAHTLDEQLLTDIFTVMQQYQAQELNGKSMEEASTGQSKSQTFLMLEPQVAVEQTGIFLTGGRSGSIDMYNTFLYDLAFLKAVYEEAGDEMVWSGIPTAQEAGAYNANITAMALAPASTQYPEAVYDAIRYLMDYEYTPYYGFSVNRHITNQQLETAQTSSLKTYPDLWNSLESGDMSREEIESQAVEVPPLDAQTVERVGQMLDHIASAGLPFGILEYDMVYEALSAMSEGTLDAAGASRYLIETMDRYMQERSAMKPYYDMNFMQSLWGSAS